jgi:hypothetical protein
MMDLEGNGRGVIKVLSRDVSGETWGDQGQPQSGYTCPNRDSNGPPPAYESRGLPQRIISVKSILILYAQIFRCPSEF